MTHPLIKPTAHWADVLRLRPELISSHGQVTGLQMSLYDAVYRTADVPYQEAQYYSDITEPTPSLVRFLAHVSARLGSKKEVRALYHLDQGMGGGKSHALVGAYHMAKRADEFFGTELGSKVKAEAEAIAGGTVSLSHARVVVLSADNMTPGKTNPVYGQALTLHERFLWALFNGDKKLYQEHLANGSDKAGLRKALEAVNAPVLILLDELMDYVLQLSDQAHVKGMPGEQAFLNALMDAVDDVPQVAFVVVMISSDKDEVGYTKEAEDFRAYVASRLERNGTTVAVSEAQDFAAIIQRRIFERSSAALPLAEAAAAYAKAASLPWRQQVFDKLGTNRSLSGFPDRLARTYPFHPDLMTLVQDDWARHAGFQRVRSTVAIFAATAHHWAQEHAAGRWAPALIGVGDLPVTVVIEDVLSSGLLHGNEKAIQGFRQVAATDISAKDGERGRAVDIDKAQAAAGLQLGYPTPALRMATALFYYSLVARGQARRGATRAEVLSAAFEPTGACDFGNAETIFNVLVSDDEGLGALDTQTGAGSAQTRYQLSTLQTLRMFHRSALAQVDGDERDLAMWKAAQALASEGLFDDVIKVSMPAKQDTPLDQVFDGVDQSGSNRLVILDPRVWTLLNGRDSSTRADIEALLGQGPNPLTVANAASCVVACVNTQRREGVRKRALDALAWRGVVATLDAGSDQRAEAELELEGARRQLNEAVRRAYQHFAFLVRTADSTHVEWGRFDDDSKTSLKGEHVWDALDKHSRAARPGKLSGDYLAALLSQWTRELSMKELGQQFTMNPAFPLVASEEDIKTAVFQLLGGGEAYEIVDGDGQALTISSPHDIALGSKSQLLRRVKAREATTGTSSTDTAGGPASGGIKPSVGAGFSGTNTASTGSNGTGGSSGASTGGGAQPEIRYKQYVLKVPNRSLVDESKRQAIFLLLGALSDVMDPTSDADMQLIDASIRITAAEGSVNAVKAKADAAGVKWEEADEDLFS